MDSRRLTKIDTRDGDFYYPFLVYESDIHRQAPKKSAWAIISGVLLDPVMRTDCSYKRCCVPGATKYMAFTT